MLRAGGRLFLVSGTNGELVFWYKLVKSSRVQPTHYLDQGEIDFKRNTLPAAGEVLKIDLVRAWNAG